MTLALIYAVLVVTLSAAALAMVLVTVGRQSEEGRQR